MARRGVYSTTRHEAKQSLPAKDDDHECEQMHSSFDKASQSPYNSMLQVRLIAARIVHELRTAIFSLDRFCVHAEVVEPNQEDYLLSYDHLVLVRWENVT